MKLASEILGVLIALQSCTAPWDPRHRKNRAALAKLHLMGFASWVDGGWVITETGRASLSHEGEAKS